MEPPVFFAILAAIFAAYPEGLEKSIGTKIFFINCCLNLKYSYYLKLRKNNELQSFDKS